MNKLKAFKKGAIKAGQSIVATTILTTGILGTNQDAPNMGTLVALNATTPATVERPAANQFELLWLDADNVIINGEILANEAACAKYPDKADTIRKFIESNLSAAARETDTQPQTWQTVPPATMQEIEQRVKNFDINDYLPKVDNEPTIER